VAKRLCPLGDETAVRGSRRGHPQPRAGDGLDLDGQPRQPDRLHGQFKVGAAAVGDEVDNPLGAAREQIADREGEVPCVRWVQPLIVHDPETLPRLRALDDSLRETSALYCRSLGAKEPGRPHHQGVGQEFKDLALPLQLGSAIGTQRPWWVRFTERA
jgi:hypothetical protein